MNKELKDECFNSHLKSSNINLAQNVHSDPNSESDQDKYLLELVEYFGKEEWDLIYMCLKKKFPEFPKTLEECKKRWEEMKKTYKNSKHFNTLEELNLIKFHNIFHNNWIKLGIQLGNKDPNHVKNHFYSMFRKTIRRISKEKCNLIPSKIIQLQILYNVELIENYLQFPEKMKSLSTNKKNKNYILTLVKALTLEQLSIFKENFKKNNQIESWDKLLIETEKSLRSKNAPHCVLKSTPVDLNFLRLSNDSLKTLENKGVFESIYEKTGIKNFYKPSKIKVSDSFIFPQVLHTSAHRDVKKKGKNIKKIPFPKTTFEMISNFYS